MSISSCSTQSIYSTQSHQSHQSHQNSQQIINTSLAYNNPNHFQQSASKIVITTHAMQRIKERTDFVQKQDIKRFVANARYKGVHLNLISFNNCNDFGISKEAYNYIKKHFFKCDNHNKLIYYKNSVFVFSGNKSRTLVTVVNLDKENLSA